MSSHHNLQQHEKELLRIDRLNIQKCYDVQRTNRDKECRIRDSSGILGRAEVATNRIIVNKVYAQPV